MALCDDNSSRCISELIYDDRYTQQLRFTGFGVDLPADATVTGIEVVVIRRSDRSETIQDRTLRLLKRGVPAGHNLASDEGWDNEWTGAYYGGEGDLWGVQWTPADFDSEGFGLVIDVSGKSYSRAEIDEVSITIYYKEGTQMAGLGLKRACQSLPAALGI